MTFVRHYTNLNIDSIEELKVKLILHIIRALCREVEMAIRLQVELHILGVRELDGQVHLVGPLRPLGARVATAIRTIPIFSSQFSLQLQQSMRKYIISLTATFYRLST
jgi:hypothetical protein